MHSECTISSDMKYILLKHVKRANAVSGEPRKFDTAKQNFSLNALIITRRIYSLHSYEESLYST